MRKLCKHTCVLIFLFASVFRVEAQNFPDGFNFYLPPDDTTIQRFLPKFPQQSIGNADFICIDENGHFAVKGKRIRFFGTNAVAGGAFPTRSKAWFIAGRLRKMGFNLVRFHHIDNPWSRQSLFEWGGDTRHLNPETLDRFEKFISQLKNNGIYANINLHVSRTFNAKDGVPDADSIKNYGKGVTYFDPQLISLQKEYAQQLLTHVNPYTGLPLVHDPVMAMIEITNENSLYRMWRDGKLKPFSKGGDLTARHNNLLDSLWHDYLLEKYSNTDSLQKAWSKGVREAGVDDQIRDGSFEHYPINRYWRLELHGSANATMGAEISNPYAGIISARIIVSQVDGINWHIQWKQIYLTIYQDSLYTVSFAARANKDRTITVSVMRDNSPWTVYAATDFLLKPEWQTYTFSFRASETCKNTTRISFQLGRETGTYWFDEIHFTSSAIKGLEPGESLELRTIRRIDFFECVNYSDSRVMDMSAFYMKLQNDFFDDMVDYLKNHLGVKVPIVGTNWNVGPPDLAVQSQLDYIDNHAYWDHPQFPNIPWSPTDWFINNTPMVRSTSGGTIPFLMGGVGFKSKPFTVSEYNHAFPNRYQTEGVLFLSSYAGFHDVDGIMFFDYSSSSDDWETDKVSGYFSIHRNTAMMALMPSCALAYRNFMITPAKETILLKYSREDVLLLPKFDNGWWTGPDIFPRKLALKHAIRNASFNHNTPFDPSNLPPEPVNPYTTDTGEITWDTNGIMQVATEQFVGITGFLDKYPDLKVGDLTLVQASDFATLTWVSLTSEPLNLTNRSLITLSSKLQNSGMIWDGTGTVHNNWGRAPTSLYPVSVTLRLHIKADSIRVHPLNPQGREKGAFTTYFPVDDNMFEIVLNQRVHRTVWFGLERFGGISSIRDDRQSNLPTRFALEQNYPNPFNSSTLIRYSLPMQGRLKLDIYDILGRRICTLVNRQQPAGTYRMIWDGQDENGQTVGSGIYFYMITATNNQQRLRSIRKMILIR